MGNLDNLNDLQCRVRAVMGETTTELKEIRGWGEGTIVPLDKLAGEPVDVEVNGKLMYRGEVVVIDEQFGIRLTQIL